MPESIKKPRVGEDVKWHQWRAVDDFRFLSKTPCRVLVPTPPLGPREMRNADVIPVILLAPAGHLTSRKNICENERVDVFEEDGEGVLQDEPY